MCKIRQWILKISRLSYHLLWNNIFFQQFHVLRKFREKFKLIYWMHCNVRESVLPSEITHRLSLADRYAGSNYSKHLMSWCCYIAVHSAQNGNRFLSTRRCSEGIYEISKIFTIYLSGVSWSFSVTFVQHNICLELLKFCCINFWPPSSACTNRPMHQFLAARNLAPNEDKRTKTAPQNSVQTSLQVKMFAHDNCTITPPPP